ncbi:MAG: carboxypeptidase-like regulatory domain-containing protein [Aigarchaeota archaeon]|nr:carboxypeptidase-like regulatory domain-containing protein [Aigarchaeota archaeon]
MRQGFDAYPAIDTNHTDIVIAEDEEASFNGLVLRPVGDIIVRRGGRLVLRNTTIFFNHSGYYEHGILLEEGSTFEAYGSQILGLDNLFFFRSWGATVILEDSTFRMTHAIYGNSSSVSILRSHLWALNCLNESTAQVKNATLCYLIMHGNASATVNGSRMIEIILYGDSRVQVSDTTLRFIFYFDSGTATISNCSYEDEIRFKPKLCELTFEVLDEETRDPIPLARISLYRPEEHEVASSSTGSDGAASFTDLEEGDYFVEAEAGGYTPLSARISLLDDSQNETLLMRRSEADRINLIELYLSILIWIVLLVAFVFSIKSRGGGEMRRKAG